MTHRAENQMGAHPALGLCGTLSEFSPLSTLVSPPAARGPVPQGGREDWMLRGSMTLWGEDRPSLPTPLSPLPRAACPGCS